MGSGNPPSISWDTLFSNVGVQGNKFNFAISITSTYYAFLSKADLDESTNTWSVVFEVQPKEWTYNVFNNGSENIRYKAPNGPASMYHLTSVLTTPLLNMLGLKNSDELAEGSWYVITLIKQDHGDVNGILYNPEIDTHPDDPAMFYGNYEMTSAHVLLVPNALLIFLNIQMSLVIVENVYAPIRVKRRLQNSYHPYARTTSNKRIRVNAGFRLAATPPVTSIGAMDIGQGNCNLLMDSVNEPFTYYDLGYPLWFYVGSLPNDMRFGNPAYLGPIVQNTAGDMDVIISHWDWDHWRLGHIANMTGLRWVVPNQPVGGASLAFFNSLTNVTVYGGAPFNGGVGSYTIYRCIPPPGSPVAMIMNNTGLALLVNMRLPTTSAVATKVLMTGDANFNSIVGPPFTDLSGIEAVHHGSNAHGAAQNLPAPIAAYATSGRIFYSYGLRISGGTLVYVYGFPVPAAVAAYQAAGWGDTTTGGIQNSTAEGTQIRVVPTTQANRGNVRVGSPAALPVVYNYSAFYTFPNTIN